uniref:Dedicator of cytokinesis protein 6 n=1 Tax=Schistocephalus solidus TaxID=70667 RepID=A0A0X3PF35_SCHSO
MISGNYKLFRQRQKKRKKSKNISEPIPGETGDCRTLCDHVKPCKIQIPYKINENCIVNDFSCRKEGCTCTVCVLRIISNRQISSHGYVVQQLRRLNFVHNETDLTFTFKPFSKTVFSCLRRLASTPFFRSHTESRSKKITFECDMLPKESLLPPKANELPTAQSSLWRTSCSFPESTDFLSGLPLIKISEMLQNRKKKCFSSSPRQKKAFLHLLADPPDGKNIPKFRKASPGIDWGVPFDHTRPAESSLFPAAAFLLFGCNFLELNAERQEPVAASAYLVDAKRGCRLTESINISPCSQLGKTASGIASYEALFRISPPLKLQEINDGDVLVTDMQTVCNVEHMRKLDRIRPCMNSKRGYCRSCKKLFVHFSGVFLVIQVERKLHTEEKPYHTMPVDNNTLDLRSPVAWTAVNLAAVIAQMHATYCLPNFQEETHSGELTEDARGKLRGRSQRMVDVFRRPHRSADASLPHQMRIRSSSCCDTILSYPQGSDWMTSSNEDLTPVIKPTRGNRRSLSKDSLPDLLERQRTNTCSDQLLICPYNRSIQLRSSKFFKVISSISFDTIASTLADVYRQESLAVNQFDLLTSVHSSTERNTSVFPPSASTMSRSLSPPSPTSASPWLSHIENPERQSALRKMKIITSVSIALSLQVATSEQLTVLMSEHLGADDQMGQGPMRLISPENELYCPTSGSSWRRSLRNLAVMSDSSIVPREPSKQQPQTATEASGVTPRPPALLRTVLEFPVKNRFYAFNCSRHLLYVYPRSLTLGQPKYRSGDIRVTVQLRQIADISVVIPAIFGHSGTIEFQAQATSNASIKDKSADFSNEIKVRLPLNSSDDFYLLFSFSHYRPSSSTKNASEKKENIGYSWLPIFAQSPAMSAKTQLLLSHELPSPDVVKSAKNGVELLNKGLLDTSKFVDPINTRFLVQTVLVSSVPFINASIGKVLQSLQPENLSKTLSEINNSDYLRVVVSFIAKGRGSCNLTDSGKRSTLLASLMQAELEDITLHIGALMDGLLQALGISLLLSPPQDNAAISQSPAANLLAVIALVVFRVSSGHPDWMEEETQRSRLLCSYLTGTSGLTETAALSYFLSGVPLFGLVWKEDVMTFLQRSHSQTNKCLSAELLHLMTSLLTDRADFLRQIFPWSAWFFLELLMRTYIQETVQNKALIIERHEYREDLLLLVTKTAKHICSRLAETITASDGTTVAWADALQQPDIRKHLGSSMPNEISLNRSLAFFLCDAFDCMNAVLLYQQISTYLGVMDERINHLSPLSNQIESDLISSQAANEIRCLVFLKLEFLQIVSSTRDFVSLSLPIDNDRLAQLKTITDVGFLRSIPPTYSILNFPIYRTVHFLPYLVLSEVHRCLASPDIKIQEQSMGLLWYCIRNLEASPHSVHLFDRPFAGGPSDPTPLYLPLLEIACDVAPALLAHWLQEDELDGDGSHKPESEASYTVRQAGGELGSEPTVTEDREQLRLMTAQSGRKFTDSAYAGARGSKSSRLRCRLSSSEHREDLSATHIGTNSTTHFQTILPHFSFSLKRGPNAHLEWSLDSIQRLLLLVLWFLYQCRDTILTEWMLRTGMEMMERLNSLLIMALHYFEYKEPRRELMEGFQSNAVPHCVGGANVSPNKDMPLSPPIRCAKSAGHSMTQMPSSFVRDILLESPPWQYSHLNCTCVEKRKLLAKTVASIVCNTLELISVTFDRPEIPQNLGIGGVDQPESTNNMLVSSRLLVNVSRTYLYGLTRQQCASSFRMLCRGLCYLMGKFPKFFFEEAHALTFSICYVLLPFCSSPLPKIRAMVTAVFYQMFRQCHRLHKHLFFLSCEMTLSVQLHLYGGLQILEDITTLLKNVDEGVDELQKLKHLTVKDIYAGGQWNMRSLKVLPLDIMASFCQLLKHRAALQGRYLQAAFNALKAYAKSDMAVDVEQRQFERLISRQGHILHSSCDSGMQYTVLTSQFHATGGFYAQMSVSVEIWMEIVTCLHRLQRFQAETLSAAVIEREHTLNLTETILRMATASRLVPELRQNWLLRLAEINLLLNQPAEAAQCLLHILASVVEQLVNRNLWPQSIPIGGASTIADQVMSANLLEECSVEAAVGLPTVPPCSRFFLRSSMSGLDGDERAWDSQQSLFVLIGQLHELVEKAVDCLMAADQFEIVTLLCHWLMPILASLGQHERLSKIHELVGTTHSAATASAEERRLCSSYFRVGFYGQKFEELNGREFVYKETPLTKLPEVTARLKEYYDKRFGDSNVFVLKDSKKVNSQVLDETLHPNNLCGTILLPV